MFVKSVPNGFAIKPSRYPMFDIEDKIYIYDLINTYFEGRKTGSKIAGFGRSKEKRSDCKIDFVQNGGNGAGQPKFRNAIAVVNNLFHNVFFTSPQPPPKEGWQVKGKSLQIVETQNFASLRNRRIFLIRFTLYPLPFTFYP
jgi:hypothetical protein